MRLNYRVSRILSAMVLIGVLVLTGYDAAFHFDRERVAVKRQHQSAQRHWSVHYAQSYTYLDSSFKYQEDINNIRLLIEPENIVLSDRATSYYLAAALPVYVKNVHAHHHRDTDWSQILSASYLCYIDQEASFERVRVFIELQRARANRDQLAQFKYWVVNRDPNNLNLRYDCLATRGKAIAQSLQKLGKLIYQGEFLLVYQID